MRHSDQYPFALDHLTRVLGVIAPVAAIASDVDKVALRYANAALLAAIQWRRDTTVASRLRVTANASACQSLAASQLAGSGSLSRQALAGFASAMAILADGKPSEAIRTAQAAQGVLYL